MFAVTPADIASCVTSQVHTSSRARVTDQTKLLIELGWTIGTADWWLREPPTSLALGAVLASIEMCETVFPEFESFVKDSGCTNVRDQSNVFRELFKKARDHQLSLRSDV